MRFLVFIRMELLRTRLGILGAGVGSGRTAEQEECHSQGPVVLRQA